ncbi:reverse transcriptase-like protein, partial [Actinobacillus pleuropneumoniae]|uniref:reverse transcriptase-like protein n=1 Tax=Actinobacillus pleuropneumoniae TaxID=715 RepID=UPI0034DD2501
MEKNYRVLQLFRDSKIVYDWLNGSTGYPSFSLRHILYDTLRLITHFIFFTCNHIYREWNIIVDRLSKEAVLLEPG